MQIRTILYQYIKTLIKHVCLLNFTYELLIINFRKVISNQPRIQGTFRNKIVVLLIGKIFALSQNLGNKAKPHDHDHQGTFVPKSTLGTRLISTLDN